MKHIFFLQTLIFSSLLISCNDNSSKTSKVEFDELSNSVDSIPISNNCGKGTTSENLDVEISTTDTGEEIFNAFIQRFHSDSIFQLSRIVLPLKGFDSDYYLDAESSASKITSNADSFHIIVQQALDNFSWDKELIPQLMTVTNYVMNDSNYNTTYEYHNKDTVIEKIYNINYNEMYESIFILKDNHWVLSDYTYSSL